MAEDLASGSLIQKGRQLSGVLTAAEQRGQIPGQVPLVAVIQLPVHVDGHAGNQKQVPVNIDKADFGALFRFHKYPAGYGQGPVQPGVEDWAAVFLRDDPGIGVRKLRTELQLEGGPVGMAGGDEEALWGLLGDTERDDGASAPGSIVFSAGYQGPAFPFGKPGVACLVKGVHDIGRRVVDAVGVVQKCAQGLGFTVHGSGASFPVSFLFTGCQLS